MEAAEAQREKLKELTASLQGHDVERKKERILEFMNQSNQEMKDLTREMVWASPTMEDLGNVERAQRSEKFIKSEFHLDAGIKKKILEAMVNNTPPMSFCAPETMYTDVVFCAQR